LRRGVGPGPPGARARVAGPPPRGAPAAPARAPPAHGGGPRPRAPLARSRCRARLRERPARLPPRHGVARLGAARRRDAHRRERRARAGAAAAAPRRGRPAVSGPRQPRLPRPAARPRAPPAHLPAAAPRDPERAGAGAGARGPPRVAARSRGLSVPDGGRGASDPRDASGAGGFPHRDAEGRARLVDVGDKPVTPRECVARAVVRMAPATLAAIAEGRTPKGDVLAVARIAGVQAAKRTADWIPLAHPLALDVVEVDLRLDPAASCVHVEATV